jgi:hypothetical protein
MDALRAPACATVSTKRAKACLLPPFSSQTLSVSSWRLLLSCAGGSPAACGLHIHVIRRIVYWRSRGVIHHMVYRCSYFLHVHATSLHRPPAASASAPRPLPLDRRQHLPPSLLATRNMARARRSEAVARLVVGRRPNYLRSPASTTKTHTQLRGSHCSPRRARCGSSAPGDTPRWT